MGSTMLLISGWHLPDKAIDCLDESAAQVRVRARG
jgi:ATP-dependent Clp protease ATP-binding subunit ClpA